MAIKALFSLDIQEINNQIFAFSGLTIDDYSELSYYDDDLPIIRLFTMSLLKFVENHVEVIHRVCQRGDSEYKNSTRYWKFKSLGCKENLSKYPKDLIEMYIVDETYDSFHGESKHKFTYKKGSRYFTILGRNLDFLYCNYGNEIKYSSIFDMRMEIFRYFVEVFESNKNTIQENMKKKIETIIKMERSISEIYYNLYIKGLPENFPSFIQEKPIISYSKRKLFMGNIDNKLMLPGAINNLIDLGITFHTYEITYKNL